MSDEKKITITIIINNNNNNNNNNNKIIIIIIIIIVIPVSGCPGWRMKRRKDEDLVGCVLLVN